MSEPQTVQQPSLDLALPGDDLPGAYRDETPAGPIDADAVREQLKAVVDPEIGIDIVNLGLIYNVDVHENNIRVEMTLTGPGCPVGPMLQSQVYGICASQPGARNVQVDMVWTPPWDPRTMASEEAKDTLGIW
ncbi:MAG TPA: metal-sulfur cluster assembly factor [Candidatus Dormibacteraeota bacterium]|jgi:metal-sulfur cluster biosynthetic enzyme|nr:metal-sulfur cluster assembly factor [Candidatus Dormibacteraeota bacterium]